MNSFEDIEVDAPSLDEARQLVKTKTPEGYYACLEEVLLHGNPKVTCKGSAGTTAIAFDNAKKYIPANVEILEEKVINNPEEISLEVEGFNENSARKLADEQAPKHAIVKSVELLARGPRTFFGIGPRRNKYSAKISVFAQVEVVYREPARIRSRIQRLPSVIELNDSLDKLQKDTAEQWLKLDKPVQGQIAALMVMQVAFEFLKKKVSEPFNVMLTGAKILFPEDNTIQQIESLNLGPPDRNYDVSDIALVPSQFKDALTRMKQLQKRVKKAAKKGGNL